MKSSNPDGMNNSPYLRVDRDVAHRKVGQHSRTHTWALEPVRLGSKFQMGSYYCFDLRQAVPTSLFFDLKKKGGAVDIAYFQVDVMFRSTYTNAST